LIVTVKDNEAADYRFWDL